MKVIEKGQPNWKLQKRCTGWGRLYENSHRNIVACRAILEFERDDILFLKNEHCTYSRADGQFSFTFKCPCCGALTDIDKDAIPDEIQECIKNRPKKEEKDIDDDADTKPLSNIEDEYYN